MKRTFEAYLEEVHMEDYTGIKDDAPDAFDEWMQNLDVDEWIELADKFVRENTETFLEEAKEVIETNHFKNGSDYSTDDIIIDLREVLNNN